MYKEIEEKLGYDFSNKILLETALTHSSNQEAGFNNERLEFLGDRVLGLVIAETLFCIYPLEQEGDLAKRHAALVQQKALLIVARKIEISEHIRISEGEKKSGKALKKSLLADSIEAIIGAIYTDSGFIPAKTFISKFWEEQINAQTIPPEDFKTRLQEWAQKNGLPIPNYQVITKTGPDHDPVFEIELAVEDREVITAYGGNVKEAEKNAAGVLLTKIDGENV